jgi:hypothetical protein
LAIGAVALAAAGWSGAQPAGQAAHAAPAHHAHKHHPNKHEVQKHAARDHAAHAQAGSADREDAAARRAQERGDLSGLNESQYQRNALARCDVFKDAPDHEACVARIRGGAVSGSVEGGGTLMESTQREPGQ